MRGFLIKACIVLLILSILVFSAQVELIETSIDKPYSSPLINKNSSREYIDVIGDEGVFMEADDLVQNRAKRSSGRRRMRMRKRQQKYRNPNCKKVDFNVNFSELGWEKFIIYPKVFNAYLCSGSCMLPFKRYMSNSGVPSTNHAQIMSILEFKNPTINKEMTKCVSTKLKPLTVIFVDENGQIKTKVYQDMIVDECGCR